MIRTILIEDEPAAIQEMNTLLLSEEDIQIIGTAGSYHESLSLLNQNSVDLIFMDISLYDCSAFDILNQIDINTYHIIFVTAYDQYAIKAIRYGALDYLLKPIVEIELREALNRYRNIRKSNITSQQLSLTSAMLKNEAALEQIALSSIGETEIVLLKNIKYCQGDGPYTHFYFLDGKTKTISKPLKYYENLLPDTFIRTHQSYLVNRSCIKSIQHASTIVLNTGEEIPISLRRKADVLKTLKP